MGMKSKVEREREGGLEGWDGRRDEGEQIRSRALDFGRFPICQCLMMYFSRIVSLQGLPGAKYPRVQVSRNRDWRCGLSAT